MFASTLLALALSPAHAADIEIPNIRTRQDTEGGNRLVVETEGVAAAALDASVEVDGVGETVPLTNTGSRLHGTAALAELPVAGTAATLTVYDAAGVALATFTGKAGSDGALRLARTTDCDLTESRVCSSADVELLAAKTFASASGYEVGLELSGADTGGIASASLDYTRVGDPKCVAWDADGACLKYDAATVATSVEVAWGSLRAVWEGDTTVVTEGAFDVTVTAYDTDGATLAWATAELVPAWEQGGASVSALSTDEDELTSVALYTQGGVKELADILENQYLTILSGGWSADETLPTYAEVALDGGETWNIPAHSYQVTVATPITFSGDAAAEAFAVYVGGKRLDKAHPIAARGLCQEGTCVGLDQDADGRWTLWSTAYAASAAELPTSVTVALTGVYGEAAPTEKSYTLAYEPDVSVVFAAGVGIVGDPAGLDLSGKIRLRGRSTLFVGHFAGQFGTNEAGNVDLATLPHGGPVESRGDILIGGEPIGIELTSDVDGDGYIDGPPAIQMQGGYGNGYMPPAGQGQTQQKELL